MVEGLKETEKLQSLFLEVLDDLQKKELLLYLMCYVQVVRREGNFSVELSRYLSCSSKSFKETRHDWRDILVELNLFFITDTYNNIFFGKDIYKVDDRDINFISITEPYIKNFEEFSHRVIKYWNIVNRALTYPGRVSLQNSLFMLSLTFNEELYDEAILYADVCSQRFARDDKFFKAVKHLSLMEISNEPHKKVKHAQQALEILATLGPVYYEIHVEKLLEDVRHLIRRVQKNKPYKRIKIEIIKDKGYNKPNLLKRLFDQIRNAVKSLKGGKKWTLDSSEIAFCCSMENYLKRPRELRT